TILHAYVTHRRNEALAKLQADVKAIEEEIARLDISLASTPPENAAMQATLTDSRYRLFLRLTEIRTSNSSTDGGIKIISPPDTPVSPSSPRPVRNALLAGLVGGVFGLGLALIRDATSDRLSEPNEVEVRSQLPVLASLPRLRDSRKRRPAQDEDEYREQVRLLLAKALLLVAGARCSSNSPFNLQEDYQFGTSDVGSYSRSRVARLLVTAAGPYRAASFLAREIATTSANVGLRTLLISTSSDPSGSAQKTPGSEFAGDSNGGSYREVSAARLYRLSIAGGDASMRALLEDGPPKHSFSAALERFDLDLVVVAASAEGVLPDGSPIARLADGVLITVLLDRTTRAELRDTLTLLRSTDAQVLGIVTLR
ncbi:MAG: hypothetical protein M3198_10310, partial [Actinomycetota bacterium]|nr:hypothetical protein [Actinomycetota bacterium]